MVIQFVGWASSIILLMTLAKQLRKQWVERTSIGVSRWLFIGQVGAEIGFTIYSVAVRTWVFACTNCLLLIENFVGLWITLRFRNRSSTETYE